MSCSANRDNAQTTYLPVIAIDGPAASGKGTLAQRLSQCQGFAYLDTGVLYRIVGLLALDRSESSRPARAIQVARALNFDQIQSLVGDARLRSLQITKEAAEIALIPSVRQALLGLQRQFIVSTPGRYKAVILDGRDIGTVVWPHAEVKLFITADLAQRAWRRWKELHKNGESITLEQVCSRLQYRDYQDRHRRTAPLRLAQGAVAMDNTHLDVESCLVLVRRLLRQRIGDCVAD